MSVSIKYSPFSKKKPKHGFSGKAYGSGVTSYAFPVYNGPELSTTTGVIYYSPTSTIALGSILYTNNTLTSVASNILVILKDTTLNNSVYVQTDANGEITIYTQYTQSYAFYEDCSQVSGSTYYYTRYNDTLTNGVVLYTDTDLTIPLSSSSVYLNFIIYTTNSNGIITINYCDTALTFYQSCTDYSNGTGGTNYYVRTIDVAYPLADNTKVYTDYQLITEIPISSGIVMNGGVYNYTPNVGTSNIGACST